MVDEAALEQAARMIIEALGDDPTREGLVETPRRFAKMMSELMEGMSYTNHEIAQMHGKCFTSTSDGMVVEKDIPVFSFCEHHIALMYDMQVSVCYVPNGKVIGLSKIARIAEMCAKRLQLQERITQDIWDVLVEVLDTRDVAVFVRGKHSCMTARGIKKPEALTCTNVLGGRFRDDPLLRAEVRELM
ncbi:MAG: GTP cyclohydrolase I FolE [Atopobiaceae bacterium]|nr:GTP cyclohydrolase I FolE [Atopobiaceae bacterium]